MQIRELFAKIGFDVEKEKLDGVEHQLKGIKELLESFAAIEVLKGIVEMTEKFGEMAEKIHMNAVEAGLTSEQFQRLAFSAHQSGISQEALAGATAKLSRAIFAARTGSAEAMLAFQRFGISGAQVAGFRNAEDAMRALADGVKRTGGGFEQLGPLMQLTGRGSKDMIEWLRKGSAAMIEQEKRAHSLGAELSNRQVEALVKVNHAFAAAKDVMSAFIGSIAAEFAPSISDAIDAILKFYSANKAIISLEVKQWTWDIGVAMGFVWEIVRIVTQSFLDFAKKHELLTRRSGELVIGFISLGLAVWIFKSALSALKTVILSPIQLIADLTKAVLKLGLGLFTAELPIWVIVAAIAALVLGIQYAFVMFTDNDYKETWIYKLIEYIRNFSPKKFIKDLLDIRNKFFGSNDMGIPKTSEIMKKIESLPEWVNSANKSGIPKAIPDINNISNKSGNNLTIQQNIHAAPGMDEKNLANHVANSTTDALSKFLREASRSFRETFNY